MANRAYAEFTDFNGQDWAVVIYDDNYSGSISEFKLGGQDGFTIDYGSSDDYDLFDAVKASKCSFLMAIEDASGEQILRDMAVANQSTFGVKVYKSDYVGIATANRYWFGFVYIDLVTIPIQPYPFMATIQAGDMIALSAELDNTGLGSSDNFMDYLQLVLRDPSTQREYLGYERLIDDGDVVLRVAYDWVELRGSGYYDRYFEQIKFRFSAADSSGVFQIINDAMRGMDARLFMYGGVFYIVQNSCLDNPASISFDVYTWDKVNNLVEYSTEITEDWTGTAVPEKTIGTGQDSVENFIRPYNEVSLSFVDGSDSVEYTASAANQSVFLLTVEQLLYLSTLDSPFTTFQAFSIAYGGYIDITSGITTAPEQFGTWYSLRASNLDKISNGQFITNTTGWSVYSFGGSSVTLSAVAGKIRLTPTAPFGGDAGAYQAILTAASTDYVAVVEVAQNTNGHLAELRVGTAAGGSSLGIDSSSSSSPNYLLVEFTASGIITYVTLVYVNTVSGQVIDFANVRVFRKSDLRIMEQMLVDERIANLQQAKSVYSIAYRTDNDPRDLPLYEGDKRLLWHRWKLNARMAEVSGAFMSYQREQYAGWDADESIGETISNNGASNNQAYKSTGSTTAYDGGVISTNQTLTNFFELTWQMRDVNAGQRTTCGLLSGSFTAAISDFDFGLEVRANTDIYIYEGGSTITNVVQAVTTNDVLKIIYEGYQLKYYFNSTLLYISTVTPSGAYNYAAIMYQRNFGGVKNVSIKTRNLK